MEVGFAGRMLAGLAVLVVILYALQAIARTGLRARLAGGDRRLMQIVESLALPGAASIHAVKIGDRYYVFGRSAGHIVNLCEIPADEAAQWSAAAAVRPAPSPVLTRLAGRLGWPRA